MPLYNYKCPGCGHTRELKRAIVERRQVIFCVCGKPMRRAMELEGVHVIPDIEPGYNESLGTYVGSRRELREKAAYQNAYLPDVFLNSDPSDGVLVRAEREELESRQSLEISQGDIFERRKKSQWAQEPAPEDGITTEGVADYEPIRDYIKNQSKKKENIKRRAQIYRSL